MSGPTTGGEQEPAPDATPDPKVRRTWRIAGVGALAGLVLAVVSGLLGGSGRVGFAVLFLVAALATGVAALYAAVTAVVDDLKGRTVARARVVAALVLFVVTAVLMALVAGAGG